MVKSVVKPLKMGFLRERIVQKKSVFVRLFGVFCFEILLGRCLAPKASALPTALHPEIFNLICIVQLSAALPVAVTASRFAQMLAFCDGCHSLFLA